MIEFRELCQYSATHKLSEYFKDNMNRILSEDYVPTIHDILELKARNLGTCIEVDFMIEALHFRLIELQADLPRKIFHCFEDVTAMMIMVDLTGPLKPQIKLFDDLVNSSK